MLSSVDLPEPEGPRTATNSPGWTIMSTPRSAWTAWLRPARYARATPSRRMTGGRLRPAGSESIAFTALPPGNHDFARLHAGEDFGHSPVAQPGLDRTRSRTATVQDEHCSRRRALRLSELECAGRDQHRVGAAIGNESDASRHPWQQRRAARVHGAQDGVGHDVLRRIPEWLDRRDVSGKGCS